MGDNKLVIIGVMLLILVILAARRQSGYMGPRAFGEVIRQLGAAGPGSPMLTPLFTTIVKQLKGEIAYREMNIIVTSLNERMPAASKFVLYASDAELNGVFTRASGSGVSSAVIPRDKAVIYLYAATAQAIAEGIRSKLPATSNTAVNSDGRIEYFEELRAASNTTAKTMLTVGFELNVALNQTTAPTGNTLSNIVNPLLPSTFTPYTTNADLFTALMPAAGATTMAPREEHVMKIMLVGVAHLCWLSEQKWDLDPQWVLTSIPGFTEPPAGGPPPTVTATAATAATCNTSSYFSASTSACVACPAGMISPMGATLETQCVRA
jgi:hypothetical protein